MILEEYLQRIDFAVKQVERIDGQMETLLQTWSRKPLVERSTLRGHLQMNQQSEGIDPVPKGGHNRDVWEKRILEQYADPRHRLAVKCDMELIRS